MGLGIEPAWVGVGLTLMVVVGSTVFQAGRSSHLLESIKDIGKAVGRLDRSVSRIKGKLNLNGDGDDD